MARQLRIEYEGAFYHVISRGNQKDVIFFEDSDFMNFIEILKRTKERYNYILHAYCLMSNHYHLLIETPKANLNRLMQNINTSYAVFVNRKYQSVYCRFDPGDPKSNHRAEPRIIIFTAGASGAGKAEYYNGTNASEFQQVASK